MRQVLRNRVLVPLQAQLTQGESPSKLALALTLGLVFGVVPVLGVTTGLCAALAVALRLNQPAIQLANLAAYPVQLILFVPAFQAGAWLFGRPAITYSLAQLQAELAADPIGTVGRYLVDNLRALVAWGLLAPVAGLGLYLLLRLVLSRLPLSREADPAAPPG